MFILQFLWAVLANPTVLIVVALGVAALVAYGYFRGPDKALKLLMDFRLWLAVVIAVLSLAVVDLKRENTAQNDKLAAAEQTETAKDDAAETLTKRLERKDTRSAEDRRIQGAINNADPDEAFDAALDEIAAIQSGDPAGGGEPGGDRVRDPDGAIVP